MNFGLIPDRHRYCTYLYYLRAHRDEGGLQHAQLKELANVAVHGLAVVFQHNSATSFPTPFWFWARVRGPGTIGESLKRHQHRGLHPRVRIVAARAVDHDREALHFGYERRQLSPEDGRVAAKALGELRGSPRTKCWPRQPPTPPGEELLPIFGGVLVHVGARHRGAHARRRAEGREPLLVNARLGHCLQGLNGVATDPGRVVQVVVHRHENALHAPQRNDLRCAFLFSPYVLHHIHRASSAPMTRAIPPSSANMAQMAVSCGEGLTHPGLHPRVRIEAARAVDHDREALHCGDERTRKKA